MALIESLNLGKFLQIAFSEGVRSQISADFRDWEQVKMNRVADADGRQLNFLFQTSYGPAAVQSRAAAGSLASGVFPTAQQISTAEHTAEYKEIDVTIELEYNMWNRARKSPSKYAEPLAKEIESKTVAAKRYLASLFYNDGLGVIGITSAVSYPTANTALVTIATGDSDRGHIGFFEYGDLLLNCNPNNTADMPAGYAWKVVSKNRKQNQVTLQLVDAAGSPVAHGGAGAIDAGDYFYRIGQEIRPDLSGSFTSDYGSATDVIPGLESLAAADGRLVHGITMSGANAASEVDGGGNPLDVSMIQEMMDLVKINVGQSSYSWKKLCMAPEAQSALIESRETDRRFQSVDDNKRGVKVFAYVHGNDTLECYTSEYVPKKRAYALPEAKSGQKPIEFYGSDFEPVRMGGMGEFHLKPASGGGHQRRIASYMSMLGTLVCKHPAAIGKLRNFTI